MTVDQNAGFLEIILTSGYYIYDFEEILDSPYGDFKLYAQYEIPQKALSQPFVESNGNYIVAKFEKEILIYQRFNNFEVKIHWTGVESFELFESDFIFFFNDED